MNYKSQFDLDKIRQSKCMMIYVYIISYSMKAIRTAVMIPFLPITAIFYGCVWLINIYEKIDDFLHIDELKLTYRLFTAIGIMDKWRKT